MNIHKQFEIGYASDRHVRGRMLTRQVDPAARERPAEWRPWLRSDVAVQLRSEYRMFQCSQCGRVDELACYRHGLPQDFVVPQPRSDWHVTDELLDIWSRRLSDEIGKRAGGQLELFDLPGDSDYVVPWPKRVYTVPAHTKLYKAGEQPLPGEAFRRFGEPCSVCGRFQSSTFHSRAFKPSADVPLAAVAIDTGDYPRFFRLLTWIVEEPIVSALKSGAFTNLRITDSFAEQRSAEPW